MFLKVVTLVSFSVQKLPSNSVLTTLTNQLINSQHTVLLHLLPIIMLSKMLNLYTL